MKSTNSYLNVTLKSIFILTLAFLFACSGQSGKEKDNFEEQKEEVVADLKKMKSSVEDAIADVEDKLNINEGPIERSLEEAKADLEQQRDALSESIEKTKNATKENWENVKSNTNKVLNDIEQGYQEAKANIEELFSES